MELEIEKLVFGGDGLARLPEADGRRQVVFVPATLPGERVEVRMLGHGKAQLLRVITASPDRIAPGCEYFSRCGGCQWQHIAPARQLGLKRDILLETLQRLGGIAWPGPVDLHASPEWGYRNRVRLEVVRRGESGVGYHERESHRIVPITHCPIASPRLNAEIAAMAQALPPALAASGAREVELVVNNDDTALQQGDQPVEFEVLGRRYRVGPGAFFQTNRFMAEALVETVAGQQSGEQAGGQVIDLFSGVGLFALPLAERFGAVAAVEQGAAAARDLRHNALRAGNIRVHAAAALDYMKRDAPDDADLLVADPPRAGLGRELTAAIVAAAPQRIHLVACDPATLARDLRDLLAGGFAIESVAVFDLFPQTYHLETVVKLIRS